MAWTSVDFRCGHRREVEIELYWPEGYLNRRLTDLAEHPCPDCRQSTYKPGGWPKEVVQSEARKLGPQGCVVEDERTGNLYAMTRAEAEAHGDTVVWTVTSVLTGNPQ